MTHRAQLRDLNREMAARVIETERLRREEVRREQRARITALAVSFGMVAAAGFVAGALTAAGILNGG